jgi:hypothetical protein
VRRTSIAVVAFLLVGLAGCNDDRIAKLEKQNQELLAQVKKDHSVQEYDLQAKCSKDSKAWFNENWSSDKTTLLLSYSNHYNKSMNKCFIEVEYHYTLQGSSWVNDMQLWDVYENIKYGDISVSHLVSAAKPFSIEELVNLCEVYGKKCKTIDEFNSLVRPYLTD